MGGVLELVAVTDGRGAAQEVQEFEAIRYKIGAGDGLEETRKLL
jgi:hypothetical protein